MALETQVLIVGAGPVGLALAIELGMRSIECIVVEKRARGGHAPRAKTTHTRTREHLRRWGIAHKLAEASPFGVDYPSNVVFVTRLGGYELARIENAFNCDPTPSALYAEHAQWIPQYRLEEVLRAHAATLPSVTILYDCRFEDAGEEAASVLSKLSHSKTGESIVIKSDFLVGADGAHSRVRDIIGARMEGVSLSYNYNIVFRAPGLAQMHRHGPAVMYWQINGEAPSLIGPMDRDDLWFFMPTDVSSELKLSDEQAAALLQRATGLEFDCEIRSRDEWVASRFLASTYRRGRTFLAGDACHLHPPFGGYGMNMGVADAVDLGWKLAAMLKGWGGEGLAESYEQERRPVHVQVIDEAVANHAVLGGQLVREGLEEPGAGGERVRGQVAAMILQHKTREFKSLGVVLGQRYGASPLIAYGEGDRDTAFSPHFIPSAAPGCRAPHAWLDVGVSLYDRFGVEFTLLTFEDAADEIALAQADARRLGVELEVVSLACVDLRAIYGARLVLVRPDQIVAWRGDKWGGAELMKQVTGQARRKQAVNRRTNKNLQSTREV